jgi:hypothetical protein
VIERQYPSFGCIPSLVEGDRELRVNGRTLGLLSGILALPTGLFDAVAAVAVARVAAEEPGGP